MESFTVEADSFLKQSVNGYYNTNYVGRLNEGNPDFLNDLKNTFYEQSPHMINKLKAAKAKVVKILLADIPQVIEREHLEDCICVCVPRSKANKLPCYHYFQAAVSETCDHITAAEDGSGVIERHTDTRTTHIRKPLSSNTGDFPYAGITKNTCYIDEQAIKGKDVILIDDIYTKSIDIDEDCLQAVIDAGARRVVFYAVAKTRRN